MTHFAGVSGCLKLDLFVYFNNCCAFCNQEIPAGMGHYCYPSQDPSMDLKICDTCYNMYYQR